MTSAPAAGWYPDPISDHLLRWWDGLGWQEQTLPKPAAATTVAQTASLPSYDESRYRPAPVLAESVDDAAAAPGEGQVTSTPVLYLGPVEVEPVQTWRPARTNTPAAWALAFLPWIAQGVGLLGLVAYAVSGVLGIAGAIPIVIAMIVFALSVSLVIRDRNGLDDLGHVVKPSAWWILLGPLVYLVARTVRVVRNSGHGAAPLVAFLINVALTAALNTWLVLGAAPLLLGTI